ncbi:hypothetical protein CsSME_00010279 [Camellia sinensis var. sinensis]
MAAKPNPIPLLTPYKMGKFNLSHRFATYTTLFSVLISLELELELSFYTLCFFIQIDLWNVGLFCFLIFTALVFLFFFFFGLFLFLDWKQSCFSATNKEQIIQQHSTASCYTLLLSKNYKWRPSHYRSHRCIRHRSGVLSTFSLIIKIFGIFYAVELQGMKVSI